MVSVADPYGRILGFLDRIRYFLFQAAPQLYSRGWVDPVPDSLRVRKSGSAGNRALDLWICSEELTTRPPVKDISEKIAISDPSQAPVVFQREFLHAFDTDLWWIQNIKITSEIN
jgi:hypothetical protein